MLQRAYSGSISRKISLPYLRSDAWHVINTRDVLLDSDDENFDEHDRLDYSEWYKMI